VLTFFCARYPHLLFTTAHAAQDLKADIFNAVYGKPFPTAYNEIMGIAAESTCGETVQFMDPFSCSAILLAAPFSSRQTANDSLNPCSERSVLLQSNLTLFDRRRDTIQAKLQNGLTPANWATYPTSSSWGPLATQYGVINPPIGCADILFFQRELLLAVENYWVDQNINYCHHHIPGWLPPDDSQRMHPKYRNSSPGSTAGAARRGSQKYGMTCTGQRKVDGSQLVQTVSGAVLAPLSFTQVQWQGMDCSSFTTWAYNFAGLTDAKNRMHTDISTQACMTPTGADTSPLWAGPAQMGVLLDINHANFDTTHQLLLPGDLLYITRAPTFHPQDRANTKVALSHVVTWTGKTWKELRDGPEGWRFDPVHIGLPSSRLGGDIARILGADNVLTALEEKNPYMIIDSHYAGPAYRPFMGWYQHSLSHIRRIIGANAVTYNSQLQELIIRQQPSKNNSTLIVLMSKRALAKGTTGYQLQYQKPARGSPICTRHGIAN
jgi:hypothetical protein